MAIGDVEIRFHAENGEEITETEAEEFGIRCESETTLDLVDELENNHIIDPVDYF